MTSRQTLTFTILAAGLLVAASCSSSKPSAGPTPTTPPSVSASSSSPDTTPVTTSPAPAITTTTAAPGATSSDGVARAFFAGWVIGNVARMTAYATSPSVVGTATARRTGGAGGFEFLSCQGAAGTMFCTWVRAGERVVVAVQQINQPPRVSSLRRETLTPQTTAQELLDAWQAPIADAAGAVRALAQPPAVAQLAALASYRAGSFSFDRCDGAAGSSHCIWHDGTATLTMQIRNAPPPLATNVTFTP